ncbi:MAG: 3'(2'),5'-bisphosphate nucleotidase [Candidatus Cloacimonetes bacterium 4572_55]|nr:MAG: 3'(2'),5'-bisphosphate nucleotidase [Candidatus Cloacimonetes bacterium 4572_55]
MLDKININKIIEIAVEAGSKILEVYRQDFEVETKKDHSPITQADQRSHNHIVARLTDLFPTIPILSEEGRHTPYSEREKWEYYWLIDPLDGTKEFVKRNGQFTVNIALIWEQRPVVGVVYAPVPDTLYFAKKGHGAYKRENGKTPARLCPDPYPTSDDKPLRVAVSSSHPSDALTQYLSQLNVGEKVEMGSSLKLCLVADGKADIYPRLGPTMEWDTAAAHAVVNEAGKKVYRYDSTEEVVYNKKNLLNPWFKVC